ncbi:MAG: S8 family serine peptidase [Planctomycetes bacterium]|nr:S8 family serine peptidase [Planctomycetota bacterium]
MTSDRRPSRPARGNAVLPLALVSTALGAFAVQSTRAQDAPASPADTVIAVDGGRTLLRLRGGTQAEVSRDGGRNYLPFVAPLGTLELRYARFDPLVQGEPSVPANLQAPGDNRLFLVQFVTDVLPEYRDALAALGARRYHVAPHQAYVVRMDRALLEHVRALPFVRWVGEFHAAYKLHESILADLASGALPRREYNVVMVDDVLDRGTLLAAIDRVRGRAQPDSGQGILQVAELDAEQLLAIARLDCVLWIDPLTAAGTDVDQARIQGGANYIETFGFDGKGVVGMVMEGIYGDPAQGIALHTELAAQAPYRTAPVAFPNATAAAPTAHGMNTAGEIYARGVNPLYRGLLPFAQPLYCNYSYVYNTNNRKSVTQWGLARGEMIETASWGYTQITTYDARSAEMDDIIFDLGVLTTQSQSNTNSLNSRPQAWAKNILAVGGFNHANTASPTDDTASGASFGPAADGRMKPDFCAYYDAIGTTSGSTSYTSGFGGTSGATPLVNGHCGLVVEMFARGLFGQDAAAGWQDLFAHRPKFTTAKSLLGVTSYLYGETRFGSAAQTRARQGFGFPDLRAMFDDAARMLVSDEEFALQQGQSRFWMVWVRPGTPALRIGMNYADPEAAPPFSITRQNSVDLEVIAPNGTRYFGNQGMTTLSSPTPSNWTSPGGTANDRDTSEYVFIANPSPGPWLVRVGATVVRVDGHVETTESDVDFGVAIRGIGGSRNREGALLDLASNAPGSFTVDLTNLPAGWAEGFTVFSVATALPLGNGSFFGAELDPLAAACLAQPVGSVFHFTPTTPGFPAGTYAFPAVIAQALQGVTFDAVAVFYDAAGNVIDVSNADRVRVQ